MAVKNAWLNVKVGESQLAVASGSEFASRWFRPSVYRPFTTKRLDRIRKLSFCGGPCRMGQEPWC